MEGVTLTIEPDVEVRFNAGNALQIDGELIARGTGGSASNGIRVFNNGAPKMTHNTITDNAGRGVSVTSNGSIEISASIVSDNHDGGIYADGGGTVTISGNTITGNSTPGQGGGIYSAAGTATISGNTILNNTAGDGQGGVHISGAPDFNDNNLYGNADYDLYNGNAQGSPDVNAENNWWGTTDPAQIIAHIRDWFDDSNLGIVDFTPYLTSTNTVAPISPRPVWPPPPMAPPSR